MSIHIALSFPKLKSRVVVTALVTLAGLSFSLPLLAQQQGPLPPAAPQDDYPASLPRATPPTSPAPPTSVRVSDSKQSSPGLSTSR